MKIWKERFNTTRNSMINKFVFLIFAQTSLVIFLYIWTLDDNRQNFATPPPAISVVVSRFICGFFLHISQEDEVKVAFEMMKYTTNHPWKFEHWLVAFFANFMQIAILLLVEFISILILIQ